MAFQFAHIQTYSRKGNKTNRSVAEICAEAGRVPGHHPHVAEALPPTVIAGDFHPKQVPEEIERRVAEAKARLKGKTVKTRKVIRDDTHVLEAQVYSHPVYVRPASAEHEGEERPCLENEADREAYISWRNATVEFVYREGERRGRFAFCPGWTKGRRHKGRNRKSVELTEGKILQRIGNREYSAAMRQ